MLRARPCHNSLVACSVAGWAKRKFKPQATPSRWRMVHNIWYTTLGILQWTAFEVIFMRLWATGRLPYIADAEALATPGNIARMVLWTLFVPAWRDFHFYFAHRFIHIRALYKYVHSLHHRNTDIEPFSGLCMHPVEHMYYFSCVGPSVYLYMSPFHLMWNGYLQVLVLWPMTVGCWKRRAIFG